MDLNTIWFLFVGLLLTGYAVLDGFDLGAGSLLLFAKEDQDRRVFLNAIGPVWSGNEVWLVTGAGALFAAFPEVYATVFSGFYDSLMLLIFTLIFRAVAIEFRNQRPGSTWRSTWDVAFAISSMLAALLVGIAVGNLIWGIPLDAKHDFQGNFLTLLHPYTILVGLASVALLTMHSNLYLILKTEGALQQKLIGWSKKTVRIYLAFYLMLSAATVLTCPHIVAAIQQRPILINTLFILSLLITFAIPRQLKLGRDGRAFILSSLSIVSLMFLLGASIYPNMVISTPTISHSLTIYNGSATHKSLNFMFYVALIGVPIVLTYTATIYYIFRGKVVLTDESY